MDLRKFTYTGHTKISHFTLHSRPYYWVGGEVIAMTMVKRWSRDVFSVGQVVKDNFSIGKGYNQLRRVKWSELNQLTLELYGGQVSTMCCFSCKANWRCPNLVPRLFCGGGRKRAWYTLFAHAPSSLRNLYTILLQ